MIMKPLTILSAPEKRQSADKSPCRNHEKHILEARNNKESSGNKFIFLTHQTHID